MDVPPAPDAASDAQPVEPTIAELAVRLEAVEAGLGRLGGRLEALAVSLEASFETAVATEVQAAAAELRHTVSELGRILVRDLGKLPQMLAKHRQAIVAELRGTDPSSAPPAPTGPDLPTAASGNPGVVDDDDPGLADDAGGDEDDVDPARTEPDATEAGGDGENGDRGWRSRRRHRQV